MPLLLLPAAAGAANYWVGNGGAAPCTHASLQPALDDAVGGAGFDVIFLVGPGPFTGPFTVLGTDFAIVGNVGSCGSTLSVGFSHVRAASGSRVLTIFSGGAGLVSLRKLEVNTQQGTYDGDGGAIWFFGGSRASQLELMDTRVNGNTATGEGGGIYVERGTLQLYSGAQVALNAARNGGGVAARNGALVEMSGGNVLVNTALFDGGGIYAPDAEVILDNPSPQATTSVGANLAGQDGGGLYLGGEELEHTITGIAGAPSVVNSNQATRGAGIFVDGTLVRLRNATLDFNAAFGEGGGAWVGNDGGLFTGGPDPGDESTLGGFPRIERNTAAEGAAFYLDDATVFLTSGRIRDHQASSGGAVTLAMDAGILFVHGVTFDTNAVPALFGLSGPGALWLQNLSFSGNTLAGGILRWQGTSSELQIAGLVLDETEPFFASFHAGVNPPIFFCSVSRHASPFAVVPPGTDLSGVLIADPQFYNPPGDLHLRHTSPAIDRCPSQDRFDAEGDVRDHDDPHHANAADWTSDAGADETTVLFADGFESGSLVPWSGDFP